MTIVHPEKVIQVAFIPAAIPIFALVLHVGFIAGLLDRLHYRNPIINFPYFHR